MYSYLAALGSRDLRKGEDRSKIAINNCSKNSCRPHTVTLSEHVICCSQLTQSLINKDGYENRIHTRKKGLQCHEEINLGISRSQH